TLGDGNTNYVNNGTIIADGSIPLQIFGGSGVTFTNDGILQEVGGSQIQLVNNVNVVGGTLATVGSQIHSLFSTLTNVTNNAGLILSGGGQTTLQGTLTNNGAITFDSGGLSTFLFLDGDVTLAGTGTLTLDSFGTDFIQALHFGDTFTIGSGQTIQGGGTLGDGNTNYVNNGTIIANGSIPLQIFGGSGVTFTNNGILQEVGGSQ